jgi:hypothetical protein
MLRLSKQGWGGSTHGAGLLLLFSWTTLYLRIVEGKRLQIPREVFEYRIVPDSQYNRDISLTILRRVSILFELRVDESFGIRCMKSDCRISFALNASRGHWPSPFLTIWNSLLS